MCINFVISDKSPTEWTWRIVSSDGHAIAHAASYFPSRPECISDAEKFRSQIEKGHADFYDSAGVAIDGIFLTRATSPREKLIKVK